MEFKEYYKNEHNLEGWGQVGEHWNDINERIADTLNKYVNEMVNLNET